MLDGDHGSLCHIMEYLLEHGFHMFLCGIGVFNGFKTSFKFGNIKTFCLLGTNSGWEDSLSISHLLCLFLVVDSCLVLTFGADLVILFVVEVWWREGSSIGSLGCV